MSGETNARASFGAPMKAFFVFVGGLYAILGIYFLLLTVDRIWPIPPLKPLLRPEQANLQIPRFPIPKTEEVFELNQGVGSGLIGETTSGEDLFVLDGVETIDGAVVPYAQRTSVNVLSIDPKNKASHWLFEGHDRIIQSLTPLYEKGAQLTGLKIGGVAMVVSNSKGNGPVVLYVYHMDGKGPVKVLTAEQISVQSPFGEPNVRVFSQTGATTVAAIYSNPDFRLLSQTPVAGMPKMAPASSDANADTFGASSFSLLLKR